MKKKEVEALEKEEHEMLGIFLAWWKIEGKRNMYSFDDRGDDVYELGAAKFVAEALLAGPSTEKNFRGAISRLIMMCCHEKEDRARFLKKLGKCLTGEIVPGIVDKRDIDIAEVVLFHPKLSSREAIAELERRGHRGLTEANYGMWKMRLTREWKRMNYRYSGQEKRDSMRAILKALEHNEKTP